MQNDDFSFLSERITVPNIETDFFLLNSNPFFVKTSQNDDLKRDQLLLNFTQKIWELPNKRISSIITPYYSMLYDKKVDNTPFFIHDIIYQDKIKQKIELDHSISCMPTLSFRTLIYDENNHIKFGLPFFYGSLIRNNTREEILTSLYLSDYIQGLPKINKLDFFIEYKGYSIPTLEDYSVSYRKKECMEETIPISCYFNQLLNYLDEKPHDRLEKTLDFLTIFFQDFNEIHKDLKRYGLGLEIHGQNLLVKLNSNGMSTGEYIYRDLGRCTISNQEQTKQLVLNEYYKSNYNFEFNEDLIDNPGQYAWLNYRTFYLSFFLYNLNQFVVTEKIELNVYDWFEKLTEKLPEIKGIY